MKIVWQIFNVEQKSKFVYLTFLMTLSALMETVSISMLIPIVVSFSNNSFIELYPSFFNFINYFLNFSSFNLVTSCLIFFFTLILFKNIFLIYFHYQEGKFIFENQRELSQRLFKVFINREYNFHIKNNSSVLVTKIRSEIAQFSNAVTGLVEIFSDIILTIGISIVLLIFSPKIFVVAFLTISFLIFIFYIFTNKAIESLAAERMNLELKRSKTLQESFIGIRDIKLSNVPTKIINGFTLLLQRNAKVLAKYFFLQKMPKIYFEVIALLIFSVLLMATYFLKGNTQYILPTVGIYAASAFRLLPSLNRIVNSYQRIKFTKPAVRTIFEELKDKKSDQQIHKKLNINNINIKNLDFSYGNEKLIFKNVNFEIKKGDKILFMGGSGVGKTTFLDLLVGLQRPTIFL